MGTVVLSSVVEMVCMFRHKPESIAVNATKTRENADGIRNWYCKRCYSEF